MKGLSPTVFLFLLFSLQIASTATVAKNGRMTREEYISRYKDDAVRDMMKTGVPASITLAQALLESNDGNSPLAVEANNHFGVKCADWTGPTYIQDDDKKDECFRKYRNALESYDDHSNFLKTRPRYAPLFENDPTDYIGWAKGLKKAGYATNPSYAELLIKIIDDNKLYELDRGQPIPSDVYASTASIPTKQATHKSSGKYIIPGTAVINPYKIHDILETNNVPYIVTKSNDTYKKIADEFELAAWQIFKYNEIDSHTPIVEGQKIYIKPKKRSGSSPTYVVKNGQSLHDIAQEQGIKLRLLKKWNNLDGNASVQQGQTILLKKS